LPLLAESFRISAGILSAASKCALSEPVRKGPKKLGFRPRQVEPRAPIVTLEDGHLAVVIRSDVRPRFCRQHGKTFDAVDGILPEDPGDAKPISPGERESPFVLSLLLRIGGRGEFEEMGRGNQAPFAFPEATFLGSKVAPTPAPLGSTPSPARRMIGAVSRIRMSSRGLKSGPLPCMNSGSLRWLNSLTAVRNTIAVIVIH
jgi:hypothetical protein